MTGMTGITEAHTAPADLDDAYENGKYIEGGSQILASWPERAAAFRAEGSNSKLNQPYGAEPRQAYDLFMPDGGMAMAKGTLIFVHGGYWMALSKDDFSHLAAGPLALGWAVAMPSYSLAPQARIGDITGEIAAAISAIMDDIGPAIDGPLRLAGHSAGGHLVTRMMCQNSQLSEQVLDRLDRVISLSGLHDLRALHQLSKNDIWQLDDAEVMAESPALLTPRSAIDLVCVVGADERPEFIRQTRLLPLLWQGLGVTGQTVIAAEENHFSIIDQMTDPSSYLCQLIDLPSPPEAI